MGRRTHRGHPSDREGPLAAVHHEYRLVIRPNTSVGSMTCSHDWGGVDCQDRREKRAPAAVRGGARAADLSAGARPVVG